MTPQNVQSRVPYLSLALTSQRIIDVLLDFVEARKERQDVEHAIQDIVPGLKAFLNSAGATGAPAPSRVFATYQQARTLGEAWSYPELETVVKTLEGLLDESIPANQQRENAEKLIDRFFDLSSQALSNFGEPSDAVPERIRELCHTR
jgi:hypothetical protein